MESSDARSSATADLTVSEARVVLNSLYWGIRQIDGLSFEQQDHFVSPVAVWKAFVSRTNFLIPAEYMPGRFTEEFDEMLEICFEYDNREALALTIGEYAVLIECFWEARNPLSAADIEDVLCLFIKARRRFRQNFPERDDSEISPIIDAIDDLIYLTGDQ
ncbi:hypothetical protein F5X97DRAFT_55138 [Nemania serpens]|nr:hypothetical protein F5X97DRAFT_55138 [Nemania serpens]